MKVYNCKNCGIERKATYSSTNTYCSNKCQKLFESAKRIKAWLKTGKGAGKNVIKNWMLKEQDCRCAICSIENKWNDEPLMFILDHIDGNSQNNVRQNLRLICSNCDSQLDTYKSKNRGNGRHARRERYAEGKSY